jgi:hypothetical protein
MSRGKRSATSIDVKTYRPSLCPNQQSSPQTDGLPTRVHSAYSLYFCILRNHQQPAQKPTRDRRLNPAIPPIEVFANPVPENHRFGLSLFFSTFNPYLSFCKFGASHASYAPPPGAAIKATPPKKTNGPGRSKRPALTPLVGDVPSPTNLLTISPRSRTLRSLIWYVRHAMDHQFVVKPVSYFPCSIKCLLIIPRFYWRGISSYAGKREHARTSKELPSRMELAR